jgi:hypothetical protein
MKPTWLISTAVVLTAIAMTAQAKPRDCRAVADPKDRLACFDAQPRIKPKSPAKAAPSPNEALFARIRAAVSQNLRDPESARFSSLTARTAPDMRGEATDVVCGQVNAKNARGGYAGDTPFVYFVKQGDFFITGTGDRHGVVATTVYRHFCQ